MGLRTGVGVDAEVSPCPLCGAPPAGLAFPYETSWDGQLYRHRACSSCGTTYVDPFPTPDQLAAVYSWDGYHEPQYSGVEHDRYLRSVRVLSHLRPPATTRLLDFGCGAGGFLRAAGEAGYDCRGIEHDADVAGKASAGAGLPVEELQDAVAASRRFDVIVLRDVLPHLVDPAATLRTLEGLLDAGGAFFFDGPLEEGRSLVRTAARSVKAVRRRAGLDRMGVTPPTMLFRVDAGGQRRFLVERMGYQERLFEVYETGWPYHVPGRRPASVGMALKEATGRMAVASASVANRAGLGFGNRFFGMYELAG